MRILHCVEFYSPSVGGSQEVVKQISERLVQRGHSVTVATSALPNRTTSQVNGVDIQEFSISGNRAYGFQGDTASYTEFLRNADFDVMMTYSAQQWTTDLSYGVLDELNGAKILAPCGFSGLRMEAFQKYFRELPSILDQFDSLIFHSEQYQDIDFARQHGLQRTTVIPNGCSAAEFNAPHISFREKYSIPQDQLLCLSVGSHTGGKGHAEAINAFRRANTGPAVLVLIGNTIGHRGCLWHCRARSAATRLMSMGQKQVILLDIPRPDVVAAFHAADLFVFPSNIECSPLVLFEAMASKTPFIATACGNASEIAEWGRSGIIVPSRIREKDGYRFANSDALKTTIEQLAQNPEQREMMAENGHRAWEKRFCWEAIVTEYERAYETAIARSSSISKAA